MTICREKDLMIAGALTRKHWIDGLRGLAMLLVVFGHQLSEYPAFFVLTSPVKIPLFFAITGYLIDYQHILWRDFFIKLFKHLIIPWLVLSSIPLIVMIPIKGWSFCLDYFFRNIVGKETWYMPCCVIAEIVLYIRQKFIKNQVVFHLSAILLSCVGLIFIKYSIMDLFMINRALHVQIFIHIGACIRKYESKLLSIKFGILTIISLIYLLICIVSILLVPTAEFDVHLGLYYCIPLCIILSVLGITYVFSVFSRINKVPLFLCFIGRNTLIFYMWESYFTSALIKIGDIIGLVFDNTIVGIVCRLLSTIISCVICSLCSLLINRYCPTIVGKTKNTSIK